MEINGLNGLIYSTFLQGIESYDHFTIFSIAKRLLLHDTEQSSRALLRSETACMNNQNHKHDLLDFYVKWSTAHTYLPVIS